MSGIPGRQISDQQSEVNSRSLCVGSHAAGGYFLHSFLRRRFCSLLSCAGSRVLLASGHQKASARFCVWCPWRKRLRFRLCPPAPSFLTYICFCALLPLLPQVQERGGMSYSESDSDDDNSLASAPRSSNAGSPPGGAGTGPKLRRRLSRNGLVSLEHTTVVVFSLGRKQQAMVFSSYKFRLLSLFFLTSHRCRVRQSRSHRWDLPTLETRLRGIMTVFHTITNVLWVRSKRKTPKYSHRPVVRIHHLPQHEAQVLHIRERRNPRFVPSRPN